MRSLRIKVDRFPLYNGLEWDKKINNPDHPNFWKYGVANLIFLDNVDDKRLVLDLGCGTGGSAFFLAEEGKIEWIVGVDLLKDMIKIAKNKARDKRLDQKICFLVCDGRYLPFKTSCFEALVSRGDAFCFLVPLRSAVQELKRVMRPNGVVILELDNRKDWKPGTVISTSLQKMPDGGIACHVETFTAKRDHKATFYVLDSDGEIAKKVVADSEFMEKGHRPCEYALQKVKEETIEIREGPLTHWPNVKELCTMFKKNGFTEVQAMGDGLLMKLLLDGEKEVIETMKGNPRLFFQIERRLVPYVDPNGAPTMILRAIAS